MYEACLKILCFDYVNIVTGGQPINNKHISISISISLSLSLFIFSFSFPFVFLYLSNYFPFTSLQ